MPSRLIDKPAASSGCGHRPGVRPGTTGLLNVAVPPSAAAGARQRELWLHVPASYDPRRPVPLLLAFHGGGGTGLGMQHSSGLSGIADQRGFLVAYPQGLVLRHGEGSAGWNASGPADPYADGIDDGLFTSDLLNAVQAGYCVDPRQIAATGVSNGGSMAGYLACVLAGRIAVFVPVEGVFFQIPGGCHPSHPAAILDVHVLSDPVAPYAGVPSRGSPEYYALAVPAWLRAWALRDRCRNSSVTSFSQLAVRQWDGCAGAVSVTGYRLASGGHTWFRDMGPAWGDRLILAFLAGHPLRAPVPGWSPGPAASVPALTAPRITGASVRVFHVPAAGAEPFDIVSGPGGTMWFTEFHGDKIGRVSPDGTITEYPVPTPGAGPYQIAVGPAGTIWFTEYNTAKIGLVTSRGQVREIALPRPGSGGNGITAGPDGTIWTADGRGYLVQLTARHVGRVRLPGSGVPFAVAAPAGQVVYVSELTGYYEYSRLLLASRPGHPATPALTLPSALSNIDALAAGPGGSVWFTDFGTGQVGELRPGGRVRLFTDLAAWSGLSDITAGPDGAMWYTDQAGLISRITFAGAISQLAMPGIGSNPDGIAAGPGGTIWVTGTGTDTIVRITLPARR